MLYDFQRIIRVKMNTRAYSNQALMAIHIVAAIGQLVCITRGDLWNSSKAQALWSLDKEALAVEQGPFCLCCAFLRGQPGRASAGHESSTPVASGSVGGTALCDQSNGFIPWKAGEKDTDLVGKPENEWEFCF